MSVAIAIAEKRILVVDDSTITRQIIRRILKNLGYTKVVEAKNGVEALARVLDRAEPIDLILLDWNMPLLNGAQFLAKLKEQPAPIGRTPVIMVSAESSPSRVLEPTQL